MFRPLVLLLLLCATAFSYDGSNENPYVAKNNIDKVERNNFYDDEGRLVFVQFIFWEETPHWHSRPYNVMAWRLDKGIPRPSYMYDTGSVYRYRMIWNDGGTTRDIRCKIFTETWTQEDVEILEREFLPKEHRKGLLKLRKARPEIRMEDLLLPPK